MIYGRRGKCATRKSIGWQHRRSLVSQRSPLLGVLQNGVAPTIIDNSPFFDLLERSKAAEAGKVVVQAAISYARRLSGGVDFTHLYTHECEAANLTHR
jgi:hypothetical protein